MKSPLRRAGNALILLKNKPVGSEAEYDGYAPQIKEVLLNGITEAELAAHLEKLAVDRMGMQSNIVESTAVARKLLRLIQK